jgi:hypothetical protein
MRCENTIGRHGYQITVVTRSHFIAVNSAHAGHQG